MERQENGADILKHTLVINQELAYAMNVLLTMRRNREEIE
jgi:hypothetical protein